MLELAESNSAKLTFFSSSEIYGDPDLKTYLQRKVIKGMFHVQVQELVMTKVKE